MTDIFISYSRRDLDFAYRLYDKLTNEGFKVWFDQYEIDPAVIFQTAIDEGITKSTAIVFLISPDSVISQYCLLELKYAIELRKHIIPVLVRPTPDVLWTEIPQLIDPLVSNSDWAYRKIIQKLNWIFFRQEQDNFEAVFNKIKESLFTDRIYISRHRDYLVKAMEWERKGKSALHLLQGEELEEAEKWLRTTPKRAAFCRPIPLQAHFICESKKNANNLQTEAFLCFASEDEVAAQAVGKSLERYGITTWIRKEDTRSSKPHKENSFKGIAGADNFIFFISNHSLASTFCQIELGYAQLYNKRVICVLVEPINFSDLGDFLFNAPLINLTDNRTHEDFYTLRETNRNELSDFQKDMEQLVYEIRKDRKYHAIHKKILVMALRWEENKRKPSLLLNGYNLEEAERWLYTYQNRATYPPTELHKIYIQDSLQFKGKIATDVFVAYSRADAGFARRLNTQLQLHQKTTWFDQESIASSVDFERALLEGIAQAKNFVFIISPESIKSKYCQIELNQALQLGRRIITVLLRDVDVSDLPKAIRTIEWIDMRDYIGEFDIRFAQLLAAIDKDAQHVEEHTHWSNRAVIWDDNARERDLLLPQSSFLRMGAWLESCLGVSMDSIESDIKYESTKIPAPTPLMIEFFVRSRAAIQKAQEEAIAKQKAEMEQQQRLLEYEITTRKQLEIQFEIEKELADKRKQAIKNQKRLIWTLSLALIILMVSSYVIFSQSDALRVSQKEQEELNALLIKKREEIAIAQQQLKEFEDSLVVRRKQLEDIKLERERLLNIVVDDQSSKNLSEAERIKRMDSVARKNYQRGEYSDAEKIYLFISEYQGISPEARKFNAAQAQNCRLMAQKKEAALAAFDALSGNISQIRKTEQLFQEILQLNPTDIVCAERSKDLECIMNIQAKLDNEGGMSEVRELDISGYSEKCLAPFMAQLEKFKKLEELNLNKTQLTQLPNLTPLKSLTKLQASNNALKTIPPTLARLKNLKSLYLTGNELTTLPDELASLEKLQKLHLSFNRFKTVPPVLSRLKSLKTLYLTNNDIPASAVQLLSTQLTNCKIISDYGTYQKGIKIR